MALAQALRALFAVMPGASMVEWAFDLGCPYGWLGVLRVRSLEAAGVGVRWRPVSLAGLRPPDGADAGTWSLAKRRVLEADLVDQFKALGRRYDPVAGDLSDEPLSLWCLAAGDRVSDFALALGEALWEGGPGDLGERVAPVLARFGLRAEVAGDPLLIGALRAHTAEMASRGAFGVPTFFVGAKMFFGQDRWPLVVEALGLPPEAGPPVQPQGKIRWIHDVSSPFSYLGTLRVLGGALGPGVGVELVPILLGALFRDVGAPMVPLAAMSSRRRDWFRQDLADQARHHGIPFRYNDHFPLRTVTTQRVLVVEPAATALLYRAAWEHDQDLSRDEILADVLDGGGFDGRALVARTQEPAVKARLAENTALAVSLGVCGVPTAAVGDSLFWGQDRVDRVAWRLSGATDAR